MIVTEEFGSVEDTLATLNRHNLLFRYSLESDLGLLKTKTIGTDPGELIRFNTTPDRDAYLKDLLWVVLMISYKTNTELVKDALTRMEILGLHLPRN